MKMIVTKRIFLTVAAVAALLFSVLFIKSCDGPEPVLDHEPPAADELLFMGVENNRITVRTPTDIDTRYVPSAGKATVTVDKTGTIDIKVVNKGFTFQPVFGLGLTREANLDIGIQLAYWNRFEFYVGAKVPHYAGFVALGYRLDQVKYLENSSLYVEYTTEREPGIGVFVRF